MTHLRNFTLFTLIVVSVALLGQRFFSAQATRAAQPQTPSARQGLPSPANPGTSNPVAPNAPAATITVNSLADGAPANNSQCTLREALLNANGDNQSGSTDCVAGSGADTITFSVTGTINLASALPDISQSLTITGPGANLLTVRRNDGAPDFRIINIPLNPALSVSLSNLTISNGRATGAGLDVFGGGILSFSNLALTNVAVTGNLATSGSGGVALGFADGVFTN